MDTLLASRILDCNLRYYGYTTLQLMEAAGKGIAKTLAARGKDVGIFCGGGNNGGDGFVAARYLLDTARVTVYLIGGEERIRTEVARHNWELLKQVERVSPALTLIQVYDSRDLRKHKKAIAKHTLIVDALLGVGISGTVREPYASTIRTLNATRATKVAIDIPSGHGTKLSFKCASVISLHTPKLFDKKIKSRVVDIGVPSHFNYMTGPGNVLFLKNRVATSKKGDNGKVLVIAGSKKYHGAALYCAHAAAHFADLVYVAAPKSVQTVLKKGSPALIVSPLEEHTFTRASLARFDAVIVGPGLEICDENAQRIKAILKTGKKTILDASALSMVHLKDLHSNCVLTPHSAEYRTLFGVAPSDATLIKHSKKCGCTIVLKGATDLICDGTTTFRNVSGNSGMTTGGTGDVLAGIIGGLAATNPVFDSALAGTFLCGYAGDQCVGAFTAYDVIAAIGAAYESLRAYIE